MLVVAIGWQVYLIHHHTLDLGLVGLAEFVPLPLLALPAGQLADRAPRRLVVAVGLGVQVGIAAALVFIARAGAHSLWPFLGVGAAAGVASALTTPAGSSLTPGQGCAKPAAISQTAPTTRGSDPRPVWVV